MILVALGSNKTGPWGNPHDTIMTALLQLNRDGLRLIGSSRLLTSTPYGKTNQPDFTNAVAQIETHLPPEALMRKLHCIERAAGRRRGVRWGPRTLDLDLIDYHGLIRRPPSHLQLPHPGASDRIFVLQPIAEIAPAWRHPILHQSAGQLLRRLDPQGEGREI